MFYAQTDPYHLSRFDALYATTGPSVRAGHSACAFTSLLRHAANFCASWAVRVMLGLLGRKVWLVMPGSGHDRPRDPRHFIRQRDSYQFEGFLHQQGSCPVC